MTSPDQPAEDELGPAEQAEPSGPTEPGIDSGPAQRITSHLGALDTLDSRPLAEHADVFHRVHAELQAALAEIDGT